MFYVFSDNSTGILPSCLARKHARIIHASCPCLSCRFHRLRFWTDTGGSRSLSDEREEKDVLRRGVPQRGPEGGEGMVVRVVRRPTLAQSRHQLRGIHACDRRNAFQEVSSSCMSRSFVFRQVREECALRQAGVSLLLGDGITQTWS